jgi:phosphate starvation-inducible protein PhoH
MSKKATMKTSEREMTYRRREGRKVSKNDDFELLDIVDLVVERKVLEPIQALIKAQGAYINAILDNVITFGIGPAGTGKSYVVAGLAADMLREKKIDRILLTRPGVEAGEKFGFIPVNWKKNTRHTLNPFERYLMKGWVDHK